MKLLLIHQNIALPNEPGGTRHYELASHLVERGHGVTIIAGQLSYLTGASVVEADGAGSKQNVGGVRVLRAYTYPALHRSFAWRIVSFLSFTFASIWVGLTSGRTDLVMGTTPPILQSVSAWLVALLRRRPFLLEVRDLWPEFAIEMGLLKNPVLIFFARLLERFLYAMSRHIIVNSPAYRDYLLRKGIPMRKISLIANGVDAEMFDPVASGESIRKELQLEGKLVVTYAGALGMANDIPTLLRAAARLRDEAGIHFLLVGDGKERSNLEAQAAELRLDNVTFAGSRPKSQMPDVLAASDACVAILQNIPMFRTTYPNKVFDYMAAGRPTVLAIDGVIRDVIEAAGGGIFVPPGDDAALAEAVLSLSRDPQRAKSMGCNARTYVVSNFDRHLQAEQFAQLVQRLAHKRRNRRGH